MLSLSLAICLFSFAGVPPLIGFFAKQQVLYSSNSAGYFFISLIAIIVSVISAFYYLKIIKIVFSKPNNALSTVPTVPTVPTVETQKIMLNSIEAPSLSLLANQVPPATFGGKDLHLKEIKKFISIKDSLITNVHSLLIGILTIFILIFIINPELLLNSIAIIVSLILNI